VRTILIVEDDVQVLAVLRDMVASLGERVLTAEQGRSALAVARETPPDLVVADLVLPGMAASELVTALRELQPQLPVVYISGYGSLDARPPALGPGDRFLRKPFSLGDLAAALGLEE
jgi:CheY-like chemotaxis protein